MEKYKIPKTRFLVWMGRISAVLLAFMIGYTIRLAETARTNSHSLGADWKN